MSKKAKKPVAKKATKRIPKKAAYSLAVGKTAAPKSTAFAETLRDSFKSPTGGHGAIPEVPLDTTAIAPLIETVNELVRRDNHRTGFAAPAEEPVA